MAEQPTIQDVLRISRLIEQACVECEQHKNSSDPELVEMIGQLCVTAAQAETMIGKILLELKTQLSPDE